MVVNKEIIKCLDDGFVYSIAISKFVSSVQCVLKKGGINMVSNSKNGLIPMCPVIGWRVCMDYRKLNAWTEKERFLTSFMDQKLDHLAGKGWYYFLMVIQVIIRSRLNLRTKIRPLSPVHMGNLHLSGCHLGYVMHWRHFNII